MCEQIGAIQYDGAVIVANTGDLRVYSEERRQERAIPNREESMHVVPEARIHGECTEQHAVLSGKA